MCFVSDTKRCITVLDGLYIGTNFEVRENRKIRYHAINDEGKT